MSVIESLLQVKIDGEALGFEVITENPLNIDILNDMTQEDYDRLVLTLSELLGPRYKVIRYPYSISIQETEHEIMKICDCNTFNFEKHEYKHQFKVVYQIERFQEGNKVCYRADADQIRKHRILKYGEKCEFATLGSQTCRYGFDIHEKFELDHKFQPVEKESEDVVRIVIPSDVGCKKCSRSYDGHANEVSEIASFEETSATTRVPNDKSNGNTSDHSFEPCLYLQNLRTEDRLEIKLKDVKHERM